MWRRVGFLAQANCKRRKTRIRLRYQEGGYQIPNNCDTNLVLQLKSVSGFGMDMKNRMTVEYRLGLVTTLSDAVGFRLYYAA